MDTFKKTVGLTDEEDDKRGILSSVSFNIIIKLLVVWAQWMFSVVDGLSECRNLNRSTLVKHSAL